MKRIADHGDVKRIRDVSYSKQRPSANNSAMPLEGLNELWTHTKGNPDITIAILDGPVDLTHPCFSGANIITLNTWITSKSAVGQASAHGTHVASVIFGQHGSAVRGIAPSCRGLIVPIFAEDANGIPLPCSQLDLARAIIQAVDKGAHVINISGGELTSSSQPHPLLVNAIQKCKKNNVLLIASVGNDGCQCLQVPASIPSTLAVGAMSAQGKPLDFSNWGKAYQTQGILALGQDILGARPGGGTTTRTGTSFATPIVSGIAGLLLSVQQQQGLKPSASEVRTALLSSANACQPHAALDCRRYLVGTLNVTSALNIIKGKEMITNQTTQEGQLKPAMYEDPSPANANALVNLDTTSINLGYPFLPTQKISTTQGAIHPSGCGCGACGGAKASGDTESNAPSLVYALGMIGYDFAQNTRRDAFVQSLGGGNPDDPTQWLAHLDENPQDAEEIIWTLNLDEMPIYALRPAGAYANLGYERLREFLAAQLNDGVQRVSIAGMIFGQTELLSGQSVPVVVPILRGLSSWSTEALVEVVVGDQSGDEADQTRAGVYNFLERIYYELRNLGVSSEERAINFAATNAFQATEIFGAAVSEGLELDQIDVEPSPVARPDADAWDVKLTFFEPTQRLERARKVYRFTIDVSDVIPVTSGSVRAWSVY